MKLLLDCDIDDGLQFELGKWKTSRSASQRSLYWMILTDMQNTNVNEHAGLTKEEHHLAMKKEYLCNIYERDDEEYAHMIDSLRTVYKEGMRSQAVELQKSIVNLTSTTNASVKQFSEYLECVTRWCNERGISYRLPEDMLKKAMGK
jgi:hypothetical protein